MRRTRLRDDDRQCRLFQSRACTQSITARSTPRSSSPRWPLEGTAGGSRMMRRDHPDDQSTPSVKRGRSPLKLRHLSRGSIHEDYHIAVVQLHRPICRRDARWTPTVFPGLLRMRRKGQKVPIVRELPEFDDQKRRRRIVGSSYSPESRGPRLLGSRFTGIESVPVDKPAIPRDDVSRPYHPAACAAGAPGRRSGTLHRHLRPDRHHIAARRVDRAADHPVQIVRPLVHGGPTLG